MYCPDCKSNLSCGCKSCMEHSPKKPNKMIMHYNDDEECPVCNKRMNVYEWFTLEGNQYDEFKKSQGVE